MITDIRFLLEGLPRADASEGQRYPRQPHTTYPVQRIGQQFENMMRGRDCTYAFGVLAVALLKLFDIEL